MNWAQYFSPEQFYINYIADDRFVTYILGGLKTTLLITFFAVLLGIALGFDAMTGFAVVALGEFVGFMAATLNPYTVAIAQSIAGVELYSGLGFRAICFVIFMGIAITYVVLYAQKVRRDPSKSVVLGDPCVHSFDRSQLDEYQFNWRHGLILLDVLVTLIVLMVGLIEMGWGYKELCGLFIIMSAVAAFIDGWSPNKYCDEMLAGAKGVLWGCILTGLAKGIVVIMQDAMIMDTVIYFLSNLLQGAPTFISAQLMLVVQTLINFIIPSGSGQAAVTMPIMAPLADSLGLSRQVACLAFQFGDGLSNLLWPTCSIVIVCGLGDVRYDRWLKWFAKLFVCLIVAQVILLQIAVMTGM